MRTIADIIGLPATYEQLAEEAAELAQASLKLARVLRKENPTPVTLGEAMDHVIEEYSDIVLMATHLKLYADKDIMEQKNSRFYSRWMESHPEE